MQDGILRSIKDATKHTNFGYQPKIEEFEFFVYFDVKISM